MWHGKANTGTGAAPFVACIPTPLRSHRLPPAPGASYSMPPSVQAEPISRGRAPPAQMPPGQSMNAPPRQPPALSYCPSMPPDSARMPSTPGRAMVTPGHSQMMATPRNKEQSNISQQHRPGYQPGPPVVVAYPAQQSKAAWNGELPGMPVSARRDPHPGLSLNAPPRRPPASLSYSPSLVVNSNQVQPRSSTSYCPSLLTNAAGASPVHQTRGSASYCPNLVAEAAKANSGQNSGAMSYCPSFVDVAKANLVRGQKGGSLSYCPSLAVDVAKASSAHATTASPLAACETMIATPKPKDFAAIGQQYHAVSMLAVYPASVAKNTVIPYKDCRQFHRDFINDHWMVPDFICHKWFQGTCEYPNSCWNQHGMTFDSALRMAFNIQLASRGRHPPVQFRSDNGGTMRQINRKDAEQLIMTTMGDFRRRGVRKWRFGTHFTDFHRFDEWDYSSDAERICADYRRAQEAARLNDVPRGRSP
eukprot:s4554_g12.t1